MHSLNNQIDNYLHTNLHTIRHKPLCKIPHRFVHILPCKFPYSRLDNWCRCYNNFASTFEYIHPDNYVHIDLYMNSPECDGPFRGLGLQALQTRPILAEFCWLLS